MRYASRLQKDANKQPVLNATRAVDPAPESALEDAHNSPTVSHILHLQATRGNQAVQRMLAVQREDDDQDAAPDVAAPVGILNRQQVALARSFYRLQARRYTPDIISQIQTSVGTTATGIMSNDDVQAVANWQQTLNASEEPGLKVDGIVGPNTLPTLFRNGLAAQDQIDQYSGEAREILERWDELGTPEARINALVAKVNEYLANAGVPPCAAIISGAAGNLGQFEFATWSLDIGRPAFTAAAPTEAQKADMADTIYHESRHAEQWFNMAQLQASQNKNTAQLSRDMGIPVNIAALAVASPLQDGSVNAMIAQGWNDSVYGPRAAHRNAVLNELTASDNALQVAQAAASANPTPANQRRLAATQARSQRAYEAYTNLPEENDANRIGARVTESYQAAAPQPEE